MLGAPLQALWKSLSITTQNHLPSAAGADDPGNLGCRSPITLPFRLLRSQMDEQARDLTELGCNIS